MSYKVRDFDPDSAEDSEKLATLFNSFDSIWPGGFTHGIPDTAVSVQERHRRMRLLAVCVVEHESGEFAGYCSLSSETGITDRAYIPLLGASPNHLNQGVGKMLLREMIRRVTANGFRQVTLHTWGGNLKAVPLYKKTGFHWEPETNVHMRNFIPGCLTIPEGKAFFAERDWYRCLKREIVVAPDEVIWHGRKVYPYRFRDGEAYLYLTFDAAAEALTALETPDYAVACWLEAEECAGGESYPVTWEIANRTGKPLEVVVLTEADAGLELKVQERLMVENTATLTRDLRVLPDARPPRSGEDTPRIRSTVLVNGQPIALETGVKIVRAVEIEFDGKRVLAGRTEKIAVKLRSRLDRDLTGTLALDPHPLLTSDALVQPFTLPAKSWTQCEFTLTATDAGILPTQLRLNAGEVTRSSPVVFRSFRNSEPQGYIEPVASEKVALETPNLSVLAWLRGGWCGLYQGMTDEGLVTHHMGELGPPFAGWRERPAPSECRLEQTAHGLSIVQTTIPPEFPGLMVERTVSLFSEEVVRVGYRVVNTTGLAQPAQIRLGASGTPEGAMVIPTTEGIIREPRNGYGSFPNGERDALPPGLPLSEDWIACEGKGLAAGVLWEGNPKRDMQWTNLMNFTHDLGEIPPHSAVTVPPLYLVGGRGDWRLVRDWWKRLFRSEEKPETVRPQAERVLTLAWEPTPALLRGEEESLTLRLQNRRGQALNGKLTLTGDLLPEPMEFPLAEVNREKSFTAEVRLERQATPSTRMLHANVDNGVTTQNFALPVVFPGRGERVEISQAEDGRFVVENGWLTLRVAPHFRGALTDLERNGVPHLFSAYPETRPFVWWNPWHGGVYPSLGFSEADEILARTPFTGKAVERIGTRGMRWQGVQVAAEPTHKNWTWLRLEAEYLTLPGSNLVALITRWTNRTAAQMSCDSALVAWTQPGGSRTNSLAHWMDKGERKVQRRSSFQSVYRSTGWAAVENPESRDILAAITSVPEGKIEVLDMADEGAHLMNGFEQSLQPYETKEYLTWLVLTEEPSGLEAYASLARLDRLP